MDILYIYIYIYVYVKFVSKLLLGLINNYYYLLKCIFLVYI